MSELETPEQWPDTGGHGGSDVFLILPGDPTSCPFVPRGLETNLTALMTPKVCLNF